MRIDLKRYRFKISILTIFLITVIYFICVFYAGTKHMAEITTEKLSLLGKFEEVNIEHWIEELQYEVKLYSSDNEILSMDKNRISDRVNLIRQYKNSYQSITVMDIDKNIVFGFSEDKKKYIDREHIKQAFRGQHSVYNSNSEEGKRFIEIASPIKAGDGKVRGVICIKIDKNELGNMLQNSLLENDMECYIVDKEGLFVTESRFVDRSAGNISIDLNKLKLSVDYAPSKPYVNYRNAKVYGVYYPLAINNWTMIIEKDASTKSFMKNFAISWGFFLGATLGIVLYIMERIINKQNCNNIEVKL